jgi:hypothetical protein
MHTTAVVSIMFATLLLCTNGADAAPWCAEYDTGGTNCGFYSFEQADFARRIHSKIRIGPKGTREGAIDATIRK